MTTTKSTTHRVVLELTAQGRTPRDISRDLDIATQTVYRHLKRAGIKPAKANE